MGNILICYGFYTSDFRLMFFKKAIEIIPFNTSLENKSSSIAKCSCSFLQLVDFRKVERSGEQNVKLPFDKVIDTI